MFPPLRQPHVLWPRGSRCHHPTPPPLPRQVEAHGQPLPPGPGREMTFEEKRKLSHAMGSLSGERLVHVLQIIAEGPSAPAMVSRAGRCGLGLGQLVAWGGLLAAAHEAVLQWPAFHPPAKLPLPSALAPHLHPLTPALPAFRRRTTTSTSWT